MEVIGATEEDKVQPSGPLRRIPIQARYLHIKGLKPPSDLDPYVAERAQ